MKRNTSTSSCISDLGAIFRRFSDTFFLFNFSLFLPLALLSPSLCRTMTTQYMLHSELHLDFIKKLDDHKDRFEHWTSAHLRVSGIYWGLSALHLLGKIDAVDKQDVVHFVNSCRNVDGGYGGNTGQDSHLLYTLSAVQVLCLLEAEDQIDRDAVASWIAALQQKDGSFAADRWGEIDTRFSYCSLNCLSLIGRPNIINVETAVSFVLSCQNWDGGFGVVPNAESHAAQMFCCIGALSITKSIHRMRVDQATEWLAERQLQNGGLNGRPEKKADVCYSWWVISCLAMLGRLSWISADGLFSYILNCQDLEDGGIADKPGNMPDVYHTFFGLAGLSLLGYPGGMLDTIDPTFAMPPSVLKRLAVISTSSE